MLCCWFHNVTSADRRAFGGDDWRGYKERLVRQGRAHAALVFDGETALGWCQYGSPHELPGITHRAEVESASSTLPDYRLTCFFVDRRHRRKGVAAAALDGAVKLIAASGGGVTECYPYDVAGKKVSGTFLHSGTRSMLERAGFIYDPRRAALVCPEHFYDTSVLSLTGDAVQLANPGSMTLPMTQWFLPLGRTVWVDFVGRATASGSGAADCVDSNLAGALVGRAQGSVGDLFENLVGENLERHVVDA